MKKRFVILLAFLATTIQNRKRTMMDKYFNHLLSLKFLLNTSLILAVTFLGVSVWSMTNPKLIDLQKKEKLIEKAFSSTPQVQIINIKSGGEAKNFGEKFDADDDWLKKFSLQVKNTSNKPIVYLRLNLNFPETKSSGNMMSFPLIFGKKPGSRFISNNASLLLKPEETLDVRVDELYDKIVRFIEQRHPLNNLNKVQVEVGYIVFEDKTAWSAGMFYKQDSNDPDRYINVGDKPVN